MAGNTSRINISYVHRSYFAQEADNSEWSGEALQHAAHYEQIGPHQWKQQASDSTS